MANRCCNVKGCSRWGDASMMIVVSGGGFRAHYCSWIHAALGALWYSRNAGSKTGIRYINLTTKVLHRVFAMREKAGDQ